MTGPLALQQSSREGVGVNRMATRKETASVGKSSQSGGAVAGRHGAGGSIRPTAPRIEQQDAESLEQCVFRSLDQYFADLGGAKPHALHQMVMGAIEKPLLQFALQRCDGNQSAAAELLGINRNTLRRKLQDYGLQ